MSYTTVLRWILRTGLALVFIIPFIIADGGGGYQSTSHTFNFYIPFSGMFFPFITGKNFVFRILIELLFMAYILLALRDPKYRPKLSMLMWAMGAFMVWMGIATLMSVDPVKSFFSNFERMEGYVTYLHLFVYFVIVGAVVEAEQWWNRLFQSSIAASAVMGAYSMLQLAGVVAISSQSGARVDGTFGNAAYLSIFMLFNIFLTLFMLVRQRQSPMMQAVYGVALVLQFATLYFTQTRGALLGVVGGLIIAALYIVWKGQGGDMRRLRRIAMWGLGAIAVLVVAFFALRSTPIITGSQTLSRLSSISLSDPTTSARFQIWNMALEGFKEKPVFGWGQENFNFVFNKYYAPQMYNQEQWFDRAHNQFLDWLIAGGLLAFLLYVSLFALAAWLIFRSSLGVGEQAIVFGLLAAYAFNNLIVFADLMSSVYFILVLAFAHSLSRKGPPRWMSFARPMDDKGVAIAAPIVLVVTLSIVWITNAPAIARAQNLLTALQPQMLVADGQGGQTAQAKPAATTLNDFRAALGPGVWPGTQLGRQEAVEQLLQYASGIAASTSVDPAVKQDALNAGQEAIASLMEQRPHDARLELFNGAFLNSFGQYEKGLAVLKQALEDSPKKQQIRFEIGVAQLNKGDNAAALATLKQAFDDAPDYNQARILYAAGLMYTGNRAAADALLTEKFGTVIVDDARLVQVYTNTKQYDRVVAIWQLRVQKDEGNVQAHLGLASAYFTAGNNAASIAELERAAQLAPSLASQIQAVIAQIKNGTLKPQ